jgi:phosphotransferase system  glucose/maltose/N-acetylglucosamine-specific IIC component
LFSITDVHEFAAAIPALTDLLAEVGAGATVIGGIIGFILGGDSTSRRALENIALGTAIGGFFGCLVSFLIYLLATAIRN